MKKLLLLLVSLFLFISSAYSACDLTGDADYIIILDDSALDIGTGQNFSVAVWVKVDAWGADKGIIAKATGTGSANLDYMLATQDSALDDGFEFYIGSGTYRYSNAGKSLNTWYHVCGTYDQTNIYIYIDGVREDGQTAGSTKNAANAGSVRIGNWFGTYLNGKISEVALWSVALTPQEITQLAKSKIKGMPLQVQSANLRAYWPLDDNPNQTGISGVTFNDLSGNGNTGTGADDDGDSLVIGESVLSYPSPIIGAL